MPAPFVHLHVHSEYSLLDGACKIPRLVKRAAELDQPALGLTDHGVMNGAVEFYKACRAEGVKPLIGMEAYLVDGARDGGRGRLERNHLTLLARTSEGFRNLVRLTSAGFLEGFRRGKPNLDMEMVAARSSGIICLTGCLQSRLCQRLLEGRDRDAREHVDDLVQVFGGENVYFEVMKNGLVEQDRANDGIARVAREVGRPLVATADVHYLRRSDFDHHAALLCVQTKSTLAEPKLTFGTNEFYLKDRDEMAQAFSEWPDAVVTPAEIAERCDMEIELGKMLLPRFDCPGGVEPVEYLRQVAREGLARRYGDPPPDHAVERLETELAVIGEMGFDSYFLIVWDFVQFAKQTGIAVGPGRGSAAGSIVSYSLDITDVDPLRYGLLFERFLNPARKSMPDIDIDFSTSGRDRVIKYVADKYGPECVAQIITFGKMAPKAATRDAGRVLGFSYSDVDRLAKLIPDPDQGRNPTFEQCLEPGQDLRKAYDSDSDAKKIVDVARGLEGIVRNNSIHAAAVVIADRPLDEIVPLQLAEDRAASGADERAYKTVTQYSMGPIEEIGLLKMDFLGLRNLDVIEAAIGIVERSTGTSIDIVTIPLDDRKTYEMLARGDSIGVFQFESEGMREALREVGPTEFEDLVALVALYRPGAMEHIKAYARGKRDPSRIEYPDDRMRPITEATYGVTLYQEQNMEVAKQMAGFSGAEADDLRKAIGKKDRALMASIRARFVDGCKGNGVSASVAAKLWTSNEAAADYSFNKSHAACYALIAYRTAYLRANYPAEYMAALISSVMSTKDKVPYFVSHCKEMGITVAPPDVNSSAHDFVVVDGDIRFGLEAVKNVGYSAVEKILKAREDGGPFESLYDFCRRVDSQTVNKRAIESLIRCGAFDSTKATRQGMLAHVERAQGAGQRAQQDAATGQGDLFGSLEEVGGGEPAAFVSDPEIGEPEAGRSELLRWEKETLGLYVSSHPLDGVRGGLRSRADCPLADLPGRADGTKVTVGGIVTESKRIRTRRGEPMMFATLDDLTGTVEMIVFKDVLEASGDLVAQDSVILVRGRVDHKGEGDTKLVVEEIAEFDCDEEARPGEDAGEETRQLPTAGAQGDDRGAAQGARARRMVSVALDPERLTERTIREMRLVLENHAGPADVLVEFVTDGGPRRLKLSDDYRVAPSPGLSRELERIAGAAVVAR